MRDYSWQHPCGSYVQERWFDLGNVGLRSLRKSAVAGVVFLVLLLTWIPTTQSALAQEDGFQRIREIAGPYEIKVAIVLSSLSLGTTLFAVYVVDQATGQPIPDVRVLLRTKHEDGSAEGKATAHNTPREPERYDAQITLDAPGIWQVTVEVDSSLGRVAVEMPPLTVAEARRISAGTFVFISIFLVLIMGAAYLWWSTQRRRRRIGPTKWSGDGAGTPGDPDSGSVP